MLAGIIHTIQSMEGEVLFLHLFFMKNVFIPRTTKLLTEMSTKEL